MRNINLIIVTSPNILTVICKVLTRYSVSVEGEHLGRLHEASKWSWITVRNWGILEWWSMSMSSRVVHARTPNILAHFDQFTVGNNLWNYEINHVRTNIQHSVNWFTRIKLINAYTYMHPVTRPGLPNGLVWLMWEAQCPHSLRGSRGLETIVFKQF